MDKVFRFNRIKEIDLPPYDDVKHMPEALIDANVDRIVRETDWLLLSEYKVNPNDSDLLDALGWRRHASTKNISRHIFGRSIASDLTVGASRS